MRRSTRRFAFAALALGAACTPATPAPAPAGQSEAQRAYMEQQRRAAARDPERAALLMVSNRPEDHPQGDFAAQEREKRSTDSLFAARAAGVLRFERITYPSEADGMPIPAYLFAPLTPKGPRAHAAMVWVHGGVHGDFDRALWSFVRDAVQRGYVVIAPDYRGSTGHGAAHYNAVDYGGKEVDDVRTAVSVLKALPYVDSTRVGMMGWSHGGYITSLISFRSAPPIKAAVAQVPVTNLVFRLGYKGPGYQRFFATQAGFGGLPFEKPAEYIKRSPLYHVDSLRIPFLVHVATNDTDVDYVEDRQMVDALRARKADLAETKIYENPPPGPAGGGHTFYALIDPVTLEPRWSPEMKDSWDRVWAFFERNLRP